MHYSRTIALATAMLALGTASAALAQSNTGVTNAAPNPKNSGPAAPGSTLKSDVNAPAGVTNGAPAPANSSYPKDTKKIHKSVKRSATGNIGGVNNNAPDAKTKIPNPRKTKKPLPSPT